MADGGQVQAGAENRVVGDAAQAVPERGRRLRRRHAGTHRRLHDEQGHQLALIALGQSAGFSLDEIGSMFSPDGQPSIDRQMLAAKADEIDRRVKRLQAMSQGLRHAALCPAPSHAECPTFQRLLRAAAAGALQRGNEKRAPRRRG